MSPEDLVKEALDAKAIGGWRLADVAVSALRSAGWLRSAPMERGGVVYAHCSADGERIAELTRERDEARKSSDDWNKSYMEYAEKVRELHETIRAIKSVHAAAVDKMNEERVAHEKFAAQWATQSSPEVLAVVEAAKRWRMYYNASMYIGHNQTREALAAAVDALAAVERKAEPKPRYKRLGSEVSVDYGTHGKPIAMAYDEDDAQQIVDALNAADAAGRKS